MYESQKQSLLQPVSIGDGYSLNLKKHKYYKLNKKKNKKLVDEDDVDVVDKDTDQEDKLDGQVKEKNTDEQEKIKEQLARDDNEEEEKVNEQQEAKKKEIVDHETQKTVVVKNNKGKKGKKHKFISESATITDGYKAT